MDRAAKTNDDISFMRLDRELNRLMIEAAHNDYAARSMKLLQGLSRRFWYMHYARRPICRCARGCTPTRRARSPGQRRGGRPRERQTDGLCRELHARNSIGLSHEDYEGKRTIDGLVVTVDGRPLDEHYEVKQFTKYGFEWTYEGESPQQLALAILYDHLGDKDARRALGAVHEDGRRQLRQ